MYFIEFLERMMSFTHLIYPSKGLDNDNNNQSFEPGQPGSMSMENLINNFPAFSKFKFPSFGALKSLFIEKYNEATWKNVHKFLLTSCYKFNTAEFFMAVQCILLIYFPGMALGIVYQYYELDQQTQQLLEKQDQDEDIYQVILQEMQQPQQQQMQSRSYIKQQLEEQSLHPQCSQSMPQSSQMIQFVQLIQRFIEQLIQTPQSMLYQIQYEQDIQYINQTIREQMQQSDECYFQQSQYYQNQNQFRYQEKEEMQNQDIQDIFKQCSIKQYHQQDRSEVIIVIIQQNFQVQQATTNSTQSNENGGVNVNIMVIRVKLPGEGRQIVKF